MVPIEGGPPGRERTRETGRAADTNRDTTQHYALCSLTGAGLLAALVMVAASGAANDAGVVADPPQLL